MPSFRSNNVYTSRYKCEIPVGRREYELVRPFGKNAYCVIKIPNSENPIYCCGKHLERARLRGNYPEGTVFVALTPAEYRVRRDDPPQGMVAKAGC